MICRVDMVLVQLWSDFKDIKSIKKIIEAIFFSFSVGVVTAFAYPRNEKC